ncbi:MAG: cation transporter [Acidimicrobiia bacterium]|nr:cation transporter [Acidimicrobiia bacterium]
MKISILYFEGCPNHPPVVEMARRVVGEHGLSAGIEEVEVSANDVVHHRFLGSPTVQVDGVDIEPAARERKDFAMSCRVYGTVNGLPPEELLLNALGVISPIATAPTSDRAGFVALGGSVVTAILSSACCWLPLLLLVFGASAAGASAFFERWRPVFIVVAVAMLALGFYFSYFRKTACADGRCAKQPQRSRRLQRTMLWGSAIVVTAFILFPNYVGLLLGGSSSTAAVATAGLLESDAREYVFDVEGMHCEGCAATLRSELVKLDGVVDAQVDYASRTARIRATGDGMVARVADVASRVGYTVTPRSRE